MGRTAVCLPLHFYAAFQNGTVAFESAEIRVNCLLMDAGETCGKAAKFMNLNSLWLELDG